MRRLSRRAALNAGTASLLVPGAAVAGADEDRDGQLVLKLVEQAHVSAETYAHYLRQPVLKGNLKALTAQIHEQEAEHVKALGDLVTKLTGTAPKLEPVAFTAIAVSDPRTLVRQAAQREGRLVGTADRTIAALSKASLASLVGSVMANDAQHAALLRLELGKDPLPSAFVPAP